MQPKNNYCVIMAGGIGSRFWPISRTSKPKQFLDILNTGKTLLQQTVERFEFFCPRENIFVVTGEAYAEITKEQIPFLSENQILLEPVRRNTAPCIAYAVAKIQCINPEATIIVAPSDHLIFNEDRFRNVIETGIDFASKNDVLVTIGIRPTRPETGYGYIQYQSDQAIAENCVFPVKTFTEKPNLELASIFLKSGDFLWNSGIFIWHQKSINKALERFAPDIYYNFSDLMTVYNTPHEKMAIFDAYFKCKSISIDYAIMEKADNVYVVEGNFGWSDLGTWGSLFEHCEKNSDNNILTNNSIFTYDVTNSIIYMPKDKVVIVQGLDDYIIAESDKYLLICKKTEEQRIREFVSDMENRLGNNKL